MLRAAGALPEAINIWIGDERSITSWHKDPFENLYAGKPCLTYHFECSKSNISVTL